MSDIKRLHEHIYLGQTKVNQHKGHINAELCRYM